MNVVFLIISKRTKEYCIISYSINKIGSKIVTWIYNLAEIVYFSREMEIDNFSNVCLKSSYCFERS